MPQFCVVFYANYAILATQRGGPWPNGLPPKYAPGYVKMTRGKEVLKVANVFAIQRVGQLSSTINVFTVPYISIIRPILLLVLA